MRSADFIAEQNYHLEMRRRLNLALHLWGIVDGLEVGVVPDLPDHFFISPGMAIDAYGREIVVAAPYHLSDDDLRNNDKNNGAGSYALWLAYQQTPARLPAAGQRVCNVADQYTRWQESFKIVITRQDEGKPAPEPFFAESLSEDSITATPLVRIGSINVTGGKLTLAWSEARQYIGLRAQRLVVPHTPTLNSASLMVPASNAASPPLFQVDVASQPLDPPLGIDVDADLYARKNLVVGDNFKVENIKPPSTTPFAATGNLKVTENLFVKGGFYKQSGTEWATLEELVRRSLPEIQIGTRTLVVSVGDDPSTGTENIELTSKLPSVSNASMIVSIAGVEYQGSKNFVDWLTNVEDTGRALQFQVSTTTPNSFSNPVKFPVTWTVGPRASTSAPQRLHIQRLHISYLALFYPAV